MTAMGANSAGAAPLGAGKAPASAMAASAGIRDKRQGGIMDASYCDFRIEALAILAIMRIIPE